MKVLWVCNVTLPMVAEELGLPSFNTLGWLDAISQDLARREDVAFSLCSPGEGYREYLCASGVHYHAFPDRYKLKRPDSKITGYFRHLLKETQPDVIHLFGTEYMHTHSFMQACKAEGYLGKTVISIQGLVSVYALHYYAGLPCRVVRSFTLRDVLRGDNVWLQRWKYIRRGREETAALALARYVIGRTQWDRACTFAIQPSARYHHCNETLRGAFYAGLWSLEKCERHSIFVSQSTYSVKGLHCLLEVFPRIRARFPDARIYVTGQDPHQSPWWRIDSYHLYIRQLLDERNIRDAVFFMGQLSEAQMRERFLRTHVFAMPSSIENSPNSLGEAMLLGVPCVCSDVGGVAELMDHGVEGFLYPFDETYMLEHYVCRLFTEEDTCRRFSENARSHARRTHDSQKNVDQMLAVYKTLCEAKLENE